MPPVTTAFGDRVVSDTSHGSAPPVGTQTVTSAIPYELIELFFFAYRDFVGGPDRLLADFSFGRAHHRVMHFVDRNPGLTIAELLDILQITKQSLNRVLKELVDQDFITVKTGTTDRRQRLLFATISGHELAGRLATLQGQRIAAALQAAAPGDEAAVKRYLTQMIEPSERARVSALTQNRLKEHSPA
jgi:DNA-binding MarR family transcriptional regulator